MIRVIRVCLLFILCISCSSDRSEEFNIIGNWEVISATRSGKQTTTVDGAIFEFSEAGGMNSNLMGTNNSSPYFLEENKIIQDIPHIEYEILAFSDSVMDLSSKIQRTHFTFKLKRME